MSKKIYVGNMNYSTDESSLKDLFSEFGTVLSAKVITDQMTGRSKGFGFIEMENDSEAAAAINALNGKECNGDALPGCNFAHRCQPPQRQRPVGHQLNRRKAQHADNLPRVPGAMPGLVAERDPLVFRIPDSDRGHQHQRNHRGQPNARTAQHRKTEGP